MNKKIRGSYNCGKNNPNWHKPHTEEWKNNLSKIAKERGFGKWLLNRKHSEETKLKISKALTNKKRPYMNKNRNPNWRGGKPKCIDCGRKVKTYRKNCRCLNCWNKIWDRGITPKNIKIRRSLKYRYWRDAVFKRDDYTCQNCGLRNGRGISVFLHSHHIKEFKKYPKLRLSVDNGQTLCKECHFLFHSKNVFKSRKR